ncbi:hypothetical protein QFZ55_003556 [Streptomyces luteogriseus]|nr:hypothetical protein [Streptomyces luteogriseus]
MVRRTIPDESPCGTHPSTPLHTQEASVFDERKEAEMRLYSERLARELALKKEREETDEPSGTPETPLSRN